MMKGALVELVPAFGITVPNVVIFQFNPETLRHTWSPAGAAATPAASGQAASHPLAITGVPNESFSFSLSMDVTDQLADPDDAVKLDAASYGIYTRLAALEMLLYPTILPDLTTGGTGGGTGKGGDSEKRPTPSAQLPVVLFVWGAGRIVPVRITSLSITEKLYDAALNPTHADAQIELRVLSPDELSLITGMPGRLAGAAYMYSQGFRAGRAAHAAANLGDSARALIGMLGNNHLLG